jgi:hypothetical protein
MLLNFFFNPNPNPNPNLYNYLILVDTEAIILYFLYMLLSIFDSNILESDRVAL